MMPQLISTANIKEYELMMEPRWVHLVIRCEGKVQELTSSADMGQLVQNKLNDNEAWAPDPLLPRICWIVGTDAHAFLEKWRPIRLIEPLQLLVRLAREYIRNLHGKLHLSSYIRHT
jgi:nicotinic acid mononucleotide adenylyltransferase